MFLMFGRSSTLLVLLLLVLNCSSVGKPREIDFKTYCDEKTMALPENLKDEQWVKVKDVRVVEESNAKCGRHIIETSQYNYHLAEQSSPGFMEKLKSYSVTLLIGIVLGISIAGGL